ncbi:PAS domain S-box protein [Paradesertivirga mongoliensis]|uniref:histidine kinase n=1 Tax=Paradesertivirga mongoliensis TaxID=2100740 RepID=A0ABW4ZPB9_9SPHI|nr:PAS domain S-box protein [Pedobacter mongoliensis]
MSEENLFANGQADKAETQSLLDDLPVAVYSCNAKGYITAYNKAAAKLWGNDPEIGRDLWCGPWKIYYPDGRPMLTEDHPISRTLKYGVAIEGEEIIVERPDGTRLNLRPLPVPKFDQEGKLIGAVNTLIDVTHQTRSDEKQAILAAIVNTSDDAIISKTLQGIITSWNKSAERLFGYTEEEAIGKHITMLIPPERLDEEDFIIKNISRGNPIDHFETIRISKDGRRIPISLSVSPVKDSRGIIIGASKIARDITAVKKAYEKQAILAAIVDTSDDAIISKSLEGIITSWNKAAERLFGYSEKEAVGMHITMLIPPDRLHEENLILDNISKGLPIDHFETFRLTKDGRQIPISLSVSPIKDSQGQVIGASKIVRDLTYLKRADERQATLAAIVNTSDDAIISKTLDGIITSWNNAAEKTFGYTEAEVIGKHISLLIPDDRLNEEDVIIGKVSQGDKIDHFETVRKSKDGKEIPISLSVSPIKDSKGTVIGASKIARDVSALKRALEESERNAANLKIINTLGKEIAEDLDIEAILQKVTDATTKLTGAAFGAFFYNTYDQDGEAYMLYTLSGAPKEAFEKFGMPRNTAVFHATFSGEGVVRVDDITTDPRYGKSAPHYGMPMGHLPVVSYLAMPVKTNSGEVIGGLFFGHPEAGKFSKEHEDLVAAIASQASVSLANGKLYNEVVSLNAKKDEFIGMASHELKTPLTSISGYMQILQRLHPDEKSKSFISKTVQQVRKLSALVNDLLDVSKIEAGKLQLVKRDFDLIKVMADAVELIRNAQTSHSISFLSNSESIIINADPNRIEQLIVNLLTNAIKYSPSANQIEVILQNSKEQVTVGVKDWGMGIEKEKLKNIFTRFYRVEGLNPSISGLGIGLYICKEIVDRHGGKIWVESVYGKGSAFWFTLPKT